MISKTGYQAKIFFLMGKWIRNESIASIFLTITTQVCFNINKLNGEVVRAA